MEGSNIQTNTATAEIPQVPHIQNDVSTEIWHQMKQVLQKQIPMQFFKAFFQELQPGGVENGTLVLTTESEQVKNHLQKRYSDLLHHAVHQVDNRKLQVKIYLKEEVKSEAQHNGSAQQQHSVDHNYTSHSYLTSQKNSQTNLEREIKNGRYPQKLELNPGYTFDRFVRGPSNEHAYIAALSAAENKKDFPNPLYLFGGVGLGKTHLLMALGNHAQEQFPWLKVRYTPSEIFQNELIEAYANKNLSNFKAKYRNIDIFLFDDIQMLSKNADSTQDELFHTFNTLYSMNKQIVISGDRPPQQLSRLTDRLRSRFQSGLIIDIKPPSFETRIAILKRKAYEMQVDLPADVYEYIATRINSQIRVLESALINLKFASEIQNRPIDRQMAIMTLKDLPNEGRAKLVTVENIIYAVSREFNVEESDIKGRSRVENIALARHVSMYLAKKLISDMSLTSIAEAFNKKDHTTVIHAEKKIKDLIDRDSSLKVRVSEIIEDLQA